MSTYARSRKKRIRDFIRVFGVDVQNIAGMLVFQVHSLPKNIQYGQEFDFWIMNNKDCFLLRVIRSKENVIIFTRKNISEPLYCILQVDIEPTDILQCLAILNMVSVPYRMKGIKKLSITDKMLQIVKYRSIRT